MCLLHLHNTHGNKMMENKYHNNSIHGHDPPPNSTYLPMHSKSTTTHVIPRICLSPWILGAYQDSLSYNGSDSKPNKGGIDLK